MFHSNKLNNLACFKIAGRKYESLSTNASINNDGDETTVVVTKFSDSVKIANNEEFKLPATIDDPVILQEIRNALFKIGYAK